MPKDLDLSQLKNKAIGVNYQWDKTTHLVRAGADNQRNFYLLEWRKYPPHTLSETIAEFVRGYKKYVVHSNNFEPLKVEINGVGGRCRQYDEEVVNKLPSFYKNLEASGRFHVVEGLALPKDDSFILCMSFLLKGLLTSLCKDTKNNFYAATVPSWRSREEEYPTAPKRVDELEEYFTSLGYSKVSTETLETALIKTIWKRPHHYTYTTLYDPSGTEAVSLY